MAKRMLDKDTELNKKIDELFSKIDQEEADRRVRDCEVASMDIFQVTHIEKNKIELTHVFNDDVYYPVLIPDELVGLVSEENEFLMTIGLREGVWHILSMSPPYYSSEPTDEDELLVSQVH